MNIIFVTIAYPRTSEESNLYSDLMDEFAEHGHNVYVACSIEEKFKLDTNLAQANGIDVLRIKTGNIIANPNYLAKGLALLQLQSKFIRAINQYFKDITFDLILYSTPPIQYNRIIKYLKRKSNATTYLLLKDIFPQNAIDIGLFEKWNPVYWHFRRQEKETYRLSDRIGCMSPANVKYLLKNNVDLAPKKVEVCVNSLKDKGILNEHEKIAIRNKIRKNLLINENDLLLIYGGNLGISQGLSFLFEILKTYKNFQNINFLIVGEGTWFNQIDRFIIEGDYKNVTLLKRVSPDDFKEMMIASDIGLIFLNPKFTIPNFPSRLTSYLEVGLPVIACTDYITDLGDIVESAQCGYKIISGDLKSFQKTIEDILAKPDYLKVVSHNSRKLFLKDYTTLLSYQTIIKNLSII